MNPKEPFFSWASLQQPVNQWLCIAFIGVWCFWTVLYYFVNTTQAVAANITSASQRSLK